MYAAILRVTFPPERRDEVVRFLGEEMLPVISANPGFVDFRVLDPHEPGELIMIDTWRRQEDSSAAANRPESVAVHERFADLGLAVASAARYSVVVDSRGD